MFGIKAMFRLLSNLSTEYFSAVMTLCCFEPGNSVCSGVSTVLLLGVCWCVSAGLLAESGPGQGYIQLLVVLDQGCVTVVKDELSQ